MNNELPQWLAERLMRPLPGVQTRTRFEAKQRFGRQYDVPSDDARAASVLVLLYPHQGRWHIPLTLRPSHLPNHAGQISLPGGAVEPGETTAQAALREFHEELGAPGHPISLLGGLSPIYVGVSNFLVTPWVAVADARPPMVPNPTEVAELLEVPVVDLLNPDYFGCETRHHAGQDYLAPCFHFGDHRIWGATCMILGELVAMLEEGAIVD